MDTLLSSMLVELRRGTLTLAVLHQLQTPRYGYFLVQLLEQCGVAIDQSTLYPLLRRLEKHGLVTSSWDHSDSRPRKYYVLSEEGKVVYMQLKKEWLDHSQNLWNVLNGEEHHESD